MRQTEGEERQSKPAPLMAPSSSTDHSGELDRHQQQPLAAGAVVKRERTKRKRPRHHPPPASSSEEDMAHCLILLAQGGASGAVVDSKPSPAPPALHHAAQPSAPTTSAPPPPVLKSDRYTSRKYTEATTTADGVKAGFYVYECRTCNKCFPTFQALGGHRASHKKPRLAATTADEEEEEIANAVNVTKPLMTAASAPRPPPIPPRADIAAVLFPDDGVTTALSLNNSQHVVAARNNSGKLLRVHECSICGAEFASGQALGGHMRRHRPLNGAVTAITMAPDTKHNKEGSASSINLQLLDLNLPAPPCECDEEGVSLPAAVLGQLGQFNDGGNKAAGLMLTTASQLLVDCHY